MLTDKLSMLTSMFFQKDPDFAVIRGGIKFSFQFRQSNAGCKPFLNLLNYEYPEDVLPTVALHHNLSHAQISGEEAADNGNV